MSQPEPPIVSEAAARALAGLGSHTLGCLQALEAAYRRLHPPALPALREPLSPLRAGLEAALAAFRETPPPAGLEPFHAELAAAAEETLEAVSSFLEPAPLPRAAESLLSGMRAHCRAQERLYPLRRALPPLGRYFVEAAFHARLDELDPEPPDAAGVGLFRAGDDARGGFCLYVPERYSAERSWPLVVALHGGGGHGAEFLWSWLREARGRGFLLLAPTSRGSTWALDSPAGECAALRRMLDFVSERWRVDRERVLLTGLSDGATFTLLAGLAEDAPYTALAPVSGVLHPASFRLGNLERARGRRITVVHGALDWLFPVGLARMTRDALQEAGAELVYREIGDLSHTYPREENDRILTWFDPELALPAD